MVWAEKVMGRSGHGPKWSWAEMVMGRNDPEPVHAIPVNDIKGSVFGHQLFLEPLAPEASALNELRAIFTSRLYNCGVCSQIKTLAQAVGVY